MADVFDVVIIGAGASGLMCVQPGQETERKKFWFWIMDRNPDKKF